MLRLKHAIAVLAIALVTPAMAETTMLEVILFPGGHNWPIWAAQTNGFFAKAGIEVKITATPNSQFLMSNLHAGKFHIGMMAIDNVVAYQEGQGPVKLDDPDFFAFMGTDHGFLTVTALPEIKTFADLKGREVSVDALATGYAFVLRRILERNGLGPGDVKIVSAGGTRERFLALEQKQHAATLLSPPFDVALKAKGYNVLARAGDVVGPYQATVGAAKRSWAKANAATLVGYIRAYRQGLAWLYDRANRERAIALLRARLANVDEATAATIYDMLVADRGGLFRDAAIDVAGVRTVLALRSAYAEPRKELNDPGRYIDISYFEEARR